MPGWKINFCSKFAVKIFHSTIANADIEDVRSCHTLFDKHLDDMLVKFKQNCMFQTTKSFENFEKKKFKYSFSDYHLSLFQKLQSNTCNQAKNFTTYGRPIQYY